MALDLHVHTPASNDWRGPQITADQLVERAIALGLDGIAITDHASGAWVDTVKEAAIGTALAVFPGVEVNDIAGNEGIHLVVLFELDATAKDIDRFLGSVHAIRGTGAAVQRGSATVGPIEFLKELDHFGAIAVLAHCRSTKGALAEMRGDLRTALIRHPGVLAAEAPAEDYFDLARTAAHKRVFDLLDGTDPTYGRELAVYQASDSPAKDGGHDLSGLGSRFTYFWAERPLSLESLRQCFIDRQARIEYPALGTAPEQLSVAVSPAVLRLQVTGGFLGGIDLRFHDGLTTVLGAKGSGKSIMVELLRFAMGQEPTQPEIARDHAAKLEKVLGVYGRVSLTVRGADGNIYSVQREYDPTRGNPYHDISTPPEELLPCHFFSQNEIVRLAESQEEQIRFIDSFFDFRSHQRGLERVRQQLSELDRDVARQIRSRKSLQALQKSQKAIKAEIATKEAGIKSPVFAQYSLAQAKTHAIDRSADAIAGVSAAVSRARVGVEAVPMPPDPGEMLRADPDVRRSIDLAQRARKEALAALVAAVDAVEVLRSSAQGEQDTWKRAFDSIADRYSREVQKAGGDQPALSPDPPMASA
jgi:PHP family Zn ribbon phosphoesterase